MALNISAPEPVVKLEDPTPVEVVKESDLTNDNLPKIDPETSLVIKSQAASFTKEIVALDVNSPEFDKKMLDISNLAAAEITKSGEGTNRILQRASTSVAGAKKGGGGAQLAVANTLGELRSTVQDLTPNPGELNTRSKILGFIPFGKNIDRYFQKYESAQTQLDNIIKGLMHGQDELHRDNATLAEEKVRLWETIGELHGYSEMAKELDANVSAEISRLKGAGQIEKANKLDSDVLFPIRQRHQDILTQIAVSVQGYLAMDLVRKNNTELIKGVDRARTTTVTALRTAIIVAQALSTQKLVLDQIDAVNTTTNNVIASTSQMLRQQTERVHEQASSSGVSVDTLTQAFDDIYATMDAIDTFKSKANESMAQTVDALSGQLNRAKPYLERAQEQEALASGNTARGAISR